MPPADFLSCDWGTTSFRLRWVAGSERRIVREIREKSGIKTMLELASAAPNRAEVFAKFLTGKLHELLGNEAPPTRPLPLVISGMASSSVGWRELPYARAPFAIDGSDLLSGELSWNRLPWVGTTHLISGVATQDDMMRGEECEIIGLMSSDALASFREKGLLILPGTHSKHVRIENGKVVDWRTFITGELFAVLGKHSLLRATLDSDARPQQFVTTHRAAFVNGVTTVRELGLAAALFRVRSHAVLQGTDRFENTAFFSGLLIGSELMDISQSANRQPVLLAGAGALAECYACAMETITSANEWQQVPPEQMEIAVVTAHGIFLDRSGAKRP